MFSVIDRLELVQVQQFGQQVQLLSGKIALAGWVIALMFLGLWSISTLVRKWGWQSETEMRPLAGIAIPLCLGILALIAVMAGAVQ
jgi:succinate dehydrogenase/fumarate reductase cytochrome b subunit